MTVRKRVKRGVAHLDATMPGWENEIDIGRLDIASPFDCVLGQLSTSYGRYCNQHGFTERWAFKHGFQLRSSLGERDRDHLNKKWSKVIKQRRELVLVA